MTEVVDWIAAEAERPSGGSNETPLLRKEQGDEAASEEELAVRNLPAHQFPAEEEAETLQPTWYERQAIEEDRERERRTYRGRTIALLRRYMRYSMETGRLPSLLGREFFRAKVTSYTVVTFEDRVIFVHDMEKCLERLDEFSRQLIARHILQEHDRWETARLLHCNEKSVRRWAPMALDLLTDILIEVGLLERLGSNREKACQGGQESEFSVSDCEDGKNKI